MEILDFILLLIIYLVFFSKKWIKESKQIFILKTIMYIYVSFVIYYTLMPIISNLPSIFNHPYTTMNLIPFIDVELGRGDFLRQIILNVIMMIPFGILYPLIHNEKKNKLFIVLYKSFLFSLIIELLQPLLNSSHSSDITDLITNTIGGLIGYLLYIVFKPLIYKVINVINN